MAKKEKKEAKGKAEETTKAAVKETTTTKTTTKKEKPPVEEKAPTGKNSYGHTLGKQSALLDDLLEKGTSIEEMAKKIGSSEGRVKSHVKHLREDLEITVSEGKDGVFKIAK